MLGLPRYVQHDMRPLFRLLEDPFFSDHPQVQSILKTTRNPQSFQPSFDVHENKESYVLEGELPGMDDKSKLDLSFIDENTLVVKGRIERNYSSGDEQAQETRQNSKPPRRPSVEEVRDEADKPTSQTLTKQNNEQQVTQQKNENTPRYWVKERMIGEFERSFSFPQTVDHDNVKASLKNGILSVVVPKKALVNKVRKISVE